MMNKLFQKLTGVLRKQVGINSAIIPFNMGRIYQCYYKNWHHDPKPLLLIIGSDAFHTLGINIHYLMPGQQRDLSNFIMMMRQSSMVMNGLAIYKVLKYRYPNIIKRSIRKYFTGMLHGKIVSAGISTLPEANVFQLLAEPYVKTLNKMINPPMFGTTVQPQFSDKKITNLRSQIIQSNFHQDISKPFSNRTQNNVIQYRQPGETGYVYPHEGD